VAFSQLIPAHTVTLFRGLISLRVPRFPLIYLITITILAFTPILSCASFLLALLGFFVSWTYLRFYKSVYPDLDTAQSTLRGDASETFAFAEFFPGPVKPAVAAFSDQVYTLLVALHICTPFSADTPASRSDAIMQRGAPGSARAEAERRRALALKALDQRLHAATKAAPPPPNMPDVHTQPQPGTQTAMTSQPADMLGSTNYVPDREHGDKDDTH
jgi:hypothetical protein